MSFICKVDPYKLDAGVSIVSVDYEVATDSKMENIIRFSYNDTVNLRSIVFDYELEKGRTYYGRTRALLSTGPLDYGPISEFTYNPETNAEFMLTTPSPINTPTISTIFWTTEHPTSCFTLHATGFEVIGNSKLTKSVWEITDVMSGKTVTTLTTNTNLTSLFVDIELNPETQYRISLTYFADNDSASKTASLIITTGKQLTAEHIQGVSTVSDTIILKTTEQLPNSKHEWYLLDDNSNILNPEDTRESAVSSFTVDHTLLKTGSLYLLQTREINVLNPDAKYEYMAFKTNNSATYGLPGSFPYKLGYGSTTGSDLAVDNDSE